MLSIHELPHDTLELIYSWLPHNDRRELAHTSKKLLKIFHRTITLIHIPQEDPQGQIIPFLLSVSTIPIYPKDFTAGPT